VAMVAAIRAYASVRTRIGWATNAMNQTHACINAVGMASVLSMLDVNATEVGVGQLAISHPSCVHTIMIVARDIV
jgi:hypothetical protein